MKINNKFKYGYNNRNRKKVFIISLFTIFIFLMILFITPIVNKRNDINSYKKSYKYYNEERLLNTHQVDNGNQNQNKLEQHQNYLQKSRTPRPPPKRNGKIKKQNKSKDQDNDEENQLKDDGADEEVLNYIVNEKELDQQNKNNNNDTIKVTDNNTVINKKQQQQKNQSQIKMLTKECLNGGIGFNNECICPYSFSGEKCEKRDSNEQCNNESNEPYMFNLYPLNDFGNDGFSPNNSLSSLCCWNKKRHMENYGKKYAQETDLLPQPSLNNIKEQSNYIKQILDTFGPWDNNDKLLLNYLLKSSKTNNGKDEQYYLKYSNDKYKKPDFVGWNQKSSNLAFFLLLTNIKMEELKMLFTYIYRSKHYYVIHVDNNYNDTKKIEELESYLNQLLIDSYDIDHYLPTNYPKNFNIMKDRFNGAWGSIALVYPEIAAYTILLDMVEEREKVTKTNETWTHVINFSINDFPVQPITELEAFLRAPTNINRNFVENGGKKERQRYTESYLRTFKGNTIALKFNQSNLCGSLDNDNQLIFDTFYKNKSEEGSQWHFITYKFAHYIISQFNPIRRLFSFKFIMIPDEIYFQQVRDESPTYPNDHVWDTYNYRFIPWDSHRLSVTRDHIEKGFPYVTYITRKVYKQDVKDLIIKKYLHK